MAQLVVVGVGPGDPELITLKGARALRQADVVVTPAGDAGSGSVARSIVAGLIDPDRQEVVTRGFPMVRDRSRLEVAYAEAAGEIAAWVRAGKQVAFVTLGDPSLYSTFLHLQRQLRRLAPEVPVEIVPGINSFSAAAARSGLSLALGDEKVAILPATCPDQELRQAFGCFDTVILLKVHGVFDRVHALLRELGLDRQAVFARRVGSAEEEIVFDLPRLLGRELDYLSLLIVRKGSQDPEKDR